VRTTIELTDLQRAQLLELAARRGERGLSKLVQEAVDAYLRENARQGEKIRAALAVVGSLGEQDAADLREAFEQSRSSWR